MIRGCFSIGLGPAWVLVIMFSSKAPRVFAEQIFQFLGFFFGVRWSTRLHRLQFVQLCGWFCWYAVIIWRALQSLSTRVVECKLECLIAHTLFLMLTLTHIIILLEAFLQRHTYYPLTVLAQDRQASQHLGLCITSVLVPNLIVHIAVVFISFKLAHVVSMPLFWFATPSSFGLQMKLYMFLSDILVANVRVIAVRESVKQLARKPLIHSTPWRQEDDAIESVRCIKQHYSQLSQLFFQINWNYGCSLLIIFIALFLNFVFNTYWLATNFLDKNVSSQMNKIHFSVVVCLGALFATVCWHCQQSYNHVSITKKFVWIAWEFFFTESTNRLFDFQTGKTVGRQAL